MQAVSSSAIHFFTSVGCSVIGHNYFTLMTFKGKHHLPRSNEGINSHRDSSATDLDLSARSILERSREAEKNVIYNCPTSQKVANETYIA